MHISKKIARQIVQKLSSMLPFDVLILDMDTEVLCWSGELDQTEPVDPPAFCVRDDNSRTLCSFGEAVCILLISGRQSNEEFGFLLDLAKDTAEYMLADYFSRAEENSRRNFHLALRNLLNNHDKIDTETVRLVLEKNQFDSDIPRTVIYFDLQTAGPDNRITSLRDDGGTITTYGLIYDNFVEYLRVTFSRPSDCVLPNDDRHSVFVFCEDRGSDEESSDVQLYNCCHMLTEKAGENFWGDFRVIIGKRCSSFSDYSGVYEQMKRRMESSLLLFPDEHIVFGRATVLGNVVAFIRSHAKRSIIQLVLGMMLQDKSAEIYLETLRELFQNNLNMNLTAERLHIHRNTLLYRLRKIEELSGYSLYNIDGALTLRLALLCYNYLEQFPNEKE